MEEFEAIAEIEGITARAVCALVKCGISAQNQNDFTMQIKDLRIFMGGRLLSKFFVLFIDKFYFWIQKSILGEITYRNRH